MGLCSSARVAWIYGASACTTVKKEDSCSSPCNAEHFMFLKMGVLVYWPLDKAPGETLPRYFKTLLAPSPKRSSPLL